MSCKEWAYTEATTFCAKVTDGTHDSPKRKEFGKPLITSKHIKGRSIDFESAYFISEEDFYKINQRSKVDQWDVIISMIGEYCGFCYVERNPVIDYAVKNVGLFKAGNKKKAEWLYYYLNSPGGKNSLASLKSGTSQPYLSLGALRSLPILIPGSEREMEKIVSILSALDDKIELNRQTNATLEAIAQAIFKEWFVDFNFPGATGEMVESELGMIPHGWRVDGLGSLSYVQNGYAFKSADFRDDGEIGIIKIKNISSNIVDIINTQFVEGTTIKNLSDKFLVRPESLLIAMTGAEIGKIGLVPFTDKPLWLNQRVGMFVEKTINANFYLYILLSSDVYQTTIRNSALGSAQPNISASAIENIKAIIPDEKLVTHYGKTVKPIFEIILNNISESHLLSQTRDNILPKLMSGEIEV